MSVLMLKLELQFNYLSNWCWLKPMAGLNANKFKRELRKAQRKLEREINREVNKVNRANKRAVDKHNRKVKTQRNKAINDLNRQIKSHNRKAETRNKGILADLKRQMRSQPRSRSQSSSLRYTESERSLADRVHRSVSVLDPREYDSFLSYARIDGSEVAGELRAALEKLDVAVWFDEVAIRPGRSQSLQMDAGLQKARSGIAVLTPSYLAGRFWTERELGTLLGKDILIPVLHDVTFEDVREYSGILPDLAGFTTKRDSVVDIAKKIAAAVLVD